MLLYTILLLVGFVMCADGVHGWVSGGYLGLWDSIIITLGFSFLVVGMDELIHMRRHRLKEQAGAARVAH